VTPERLNWLMKQDPNDITEQYSLDILQDLVKITEERVKKEWTLRSYVRVFHSSLTAIFIAGAAYFLFPNFIFALAIAALFNVSIWYLVDFSSIKKGKTDESK